MFVFRVATGTFKAWGNRKGTQIFYHIPEALGHTVHPQNIMAGT